MFYLNMIRLYTCYFNIENNFPANSKNSHLNKFVLPLIVRNAPPLSTVIQVTSKQRKEEGSAGKCSI